MSSFPIFPSEAVILGLVLEEYVQAKVDHAPASILDFFGTRLDAFVPDMQVFRRISVAESELTDFDQVAENLWQSPSGKWVHRDQHGLFRIEIDSSRRNLKDLVVELVAGFAAKSPLEQVYFLPRNAPNRDERIEEITSRAVASCQDSEDPYKVLRREGVDDIEAILAAVQDLVRSGGLEELFSIGRCLGSVLADCNRLEHWSRDWEFVLEMVSLRPNDVAWTLVSPCAFAERYRERLRNLGDCPPVRRLTYSSLIIEREFRRAGVTRISRLAAMTSRELEDENDVVAALAEARTLVGVIVGELLQSLRDDDSAARAKDASSPTPRTYRLPRDAPPERVQWQLRQAEATLNHPGREGVLPEGIIDQLANGIECLARDLWPEEFSPRAGRDGSLERVLDDRSQRGTERERRFAWIARTLYKQYRNPSVHSASFRCSYIEAVAFYHSLRALVVLAEEIKIERGR